MGSLLLISIQEGWSPLHAACSEGHVEVVKTMIELGAKLELEVLISKFIPVLIYRIKRAPHLYSKLVQLATMIL